MDASSSLSLPSIHPWSGFPSPRTASAARRSSPSPQARAAAPATRAATATCDAGRSVPRGVAERVRTEATEFKLFLDDRFLPGADISSASVLHRPCIVGAFWVRFGGSPA